MGHAGRDAAMLEKIPAAVGHALSGVRAGLDKTACRAAFADVPDTLRVTSAAFDPGGAIPARHTADGEGLSPPLAWDGLPEGTARVAVLVEDADAPTPEPLVHLIAWDVPADAPGFAPGALAGPGEGRALGRNSFLKEGWLPPDPPTGHGAHRYVFQVYALDRALVLDPAPGRGALLAAMEGRVLAKGTLIGTYVRA